MSPDFVHLRESEKLNIISLCGIKYILIVHQILTSFDYTEWPFHKELADYSWKMQNQEW